MSEGRINIIDGTLIETAQLAQATKKMENRQKILKWLAR